MDKEKAQKIVEYSILGSTITGAIIGTILYFTPMKISETKTLLPDGMTYQTRTDYTTSKSKSGKLSLERNDESISHGLLEKKLI